MYKLANPTEYRILAWRNNGVEFLLCLSKPPNYLNQQEIFTELRFAGIFSRVSGHFSQFNAPAVLLSWLSTGKIA